MGNPHVQQGGRPTETGGSSFVFPVARLGVIERVCKTTERGLQPDRGVNGIGSCRAASQQWDEQDQLPLCCIPTQELMGSAPVVQHPNSGMNGIGSCCYTMRCGAGLKQGEHQGGSHA